MDHNFNLLDFSHIAIEATEGTFLDIDAVLLVEFHNPPRNEFQG